MRLKKWVVSILILSLSINSYCQQSGAKNNFRPRLSFKTGVAVFCPNARLKPFWINESSLYGLEISFCKRFSFEASRDFSLPLLARNPYSGLAGFVQNNALGFNYYFGKDLRLKLGVYHDWRRDDNFFDGLFNLPGSKLFYNYKGITGDLGFSVKGFQFDIKYHLIYFPSPRSDWTQLSISFSHNFSLDKAHDSVPNYSKSELSLVMGVKYDNPLSDNHPYFSKVAISPILGIDLFFAKLNAGIFLRRDVWVDVKGANINSGYDITNEIKTSSIGVYYKQSISKRDIDFSISYNSVENQDYTDFDTSYIEGIHWNKGLGLSIAIPIGKIRLEARQIFIVDDPYHITGKENFSLAALFYLNTLRRFSSRM